VVLHADTYRMSRWKRWTEIVILTIGVPLAVLFWVQVAIAAGVKSVFILSGSLIAAWMFAAIGVPVLFGVMSPREIFENVQSRRRQARFYEGVPIGGARGRFAFARLWTRRHRSHRRREKFYPLEPRGGPRQGQGFPFWKGRVSFD
jgi:hypothetical protein